MLNYSHQCVIFVVVECPPYDTSEPILFHQIITNYQICVIRIILLANVDFETYKYCRKRTTNVKHLENMLDRIFRNVLDLCDISAHVLDHTLVNSNMIFGIHFSDNSKIKKKGVP